MNCLNNILVPIDFSEESTTGLNAALSFANQFNSTIHLVHFVLPNEHVTDRHPKEEVQNMSDTLHEKQAQRAQIELSDKLKQVMIDHVSETQRGHSLVIKGSLGQCFKELTERNDIDIDLIVSGTSGNRSLIESFTGNSTETMIRQSDIPLLAIKTDETLSFDNILLVTDIAAQLPKKIIKLCKCFEQSGSTIHLGHVFSSEFVNKEETLAKMKQRITHFGFENCRIHIQNDTDELAGIKTIIQNVSANVLFMKTYLRSSLEHLIDQSLAEQAVRKTKIPVLIETINR